MVAEHWLIGIGNPGWSCDVEQLTYVIVKPCGFTMAVGAQKNWLSDTTTGWLSCQIHLHVRTLQACARKTHRKPVRSTNIPRWKGLFATVNISITAHSVELLQPQLTFEEFMRPLIHNALCWARDTVRPVSQWWSTTIKMYNKMNHLLWIRQVMRWMCSMTQAHPIYGCPTPMITVVLKSQFLPQLQFLHLRRQQRHIQNRVRFGSRSGFSSEDPVNRDEVSIANCTFAEVSEVSGLGFSYSLGQFWRDL